MHTLAQQSTGSSYQQSIYICMTSVNSAGGVRAAPRYVGRPLRSASMAATPLLAAKKLPIQHNGYTHLRYHGRLRVQVAAALCASYVGGSLNFAAVAASLDLAPGPLLAAAMAADNIMMAVYLAAVGVCPADPPPARAAGAAAQGACYVVGVPVGCLHVASREPDGVAGNSAVFVQPLQK